MYTAPYIPNADTSLYAENIMSVIQLLNGQEHPVAKGGTIKKVFDHESVFEWCVAYLYGIYQLPGCPRYTGDIITSCNCLQLLPIYNNTMLGSAQFMVDLRGIHFNAKKDL